MSKLFQFTSAYFPDLNKYLRHLKQQEINFKCLPRSNLMKITRALSLKISVITVFFWTLCSASFKGHSPVHLQKSNLLHTSYITLYINVTLPEDSRSYHMLDPQSVKTLNGLQFPKIKCYCLHNASPYVNSLTSIKLLWLVCLVSS